MQFNALPVILGATTIAIMSTAMPHQAHAANFTVQSGVTSVFLDTETLSSVGLNLTGTSGEVTDPVSDSFLVGFSITPDTDFTFNDEGGFTLIGGSIEHTGGVTFNGDTDAALTVGNFSIGFDPTRANELTGATGFFVQDLLTTNAVLFDIAGVVPTFEGESLIINGDLLVSPELSNVLGDASLAGALVGSAQTNAQVGAASATVPEPAIAIGLLLAGASGITTRRRWL